jgi:zinc transport system permease protein
MIDFITNPLQYNFFQTALFAGALLGLVTPILGGFIVVARQSVVSDMLSHTALAGVGLGVLLGVNPSIVSIVTILLSGVLLWMFQKNNKSPESISMVLLTGGLSLAILFINLAPQTSVNLENYLFGNILTLTSAEFTTLVAVIFLIVAIILFQWNNLIRLVYSPDYYESTSRSKKYIELLFLLMVSLLVGVSLKSIGGLLIGGLIVIPVLAAQNITQNFRKTACLASFIGFSSVLTGIYTSYHLDIPTSSSIILTCIVIFILTTLLTFKSK